MIEILAQDWASLAMPLGVLAATLGAGYLIKRALFAWLRRWSALTTNGAAQMAVDFVRQRFMFWMLILALHLAARFSQRPEWSVGHAAPLLLALWILSLAGPGARLASRVFKDKRCAFGHTWNWPRRRAGIDTQLCSACGVERRSPVQFASAKPQRPVPAG
jgi:hypothetical protein